MALSGKDLRVLAMLCRDGYVPAFGRVADLGAQVISSDVRPDAEEFRELAQARGLAGIPATPCRDARELWQWLGLLPTVFDIDGTSKAIPLDLNFDRVPFRMRGKFAVVTNYGTSEHVANQYNVFKVMHDLTQRWGVMIHHTTSQGYLNHGLLNYNPKFFWRLTQGNRYKILYHDFNVGHGEPFPTNVISEIEPYEPSIAARTAHLRVTDCSVTVVCQKMHAGPFLPPLDVDVMLDSDKLERRYWTMYGERRSDRIRQAVYNFPSEMQRIRGRIGKLAEANSITRRPYQAARHVWRMVKIAAGRQ